MVESQLENLSRASTPDAISLLGKSPHYPTLQNGEFGQQDDWNPDSSPSPTPFDSVPEPKSPRPLNPQSFYEQHNLTTTEFLGSLGEGNNSPPDSMPDDASNQSTPVQNRPRAHTRRRTSNSGNVHRPPAGLPSVSSPSSAHFPTSTSGNDLPNLAFRPSIIHYSSSPPPYSQGSGFFGQYTLPTQPPSLTIGQANPTYPYPPTFHSVDGSSVSSPVQHGYPQHAHQNQSPYHFAHRRSDEGSNQSPPFNRVSSSPLFVRTQGPRNPHDGGTGGQISSYMASPPYQAIAYSSPLPSPQYGYPQQFQGPPSVYQAFGTMHYPHHTSSPPEVDTAPPQGSWYFFPHNPQSQQPSYEPVQYRPSGYQYQYQHLAQQPEPHPHVSPAPSTTSSAPQQQHPLEFQNPISPPPSASIRSSNTGKGSPASSVAPSQSSKSVVRREWHPRPPAHRSPWVMWVGNVPSDATQEELWKFFTQIPTSESPEVAENSGVESIFLISRSNCAFVNYNNEESVTNAIRIVNGMRLRPNDPQCPMLVCKIRRSADDLKSGVGGQRGIGLHKEWVQDKRTLKGRSDIELSDDHSGSGLVDDLGSLSLSSKEARGRRGTHTSSSSSHASTTSSFLAENFPIRFFILKSLSEDDLNLSVRNGLWATQKHNELLLDQAFRTAKDVFLIFSVNKSGEFYGYARMTGPIRQGEGNVAWASRSEGTFSSSSSSDSPNVRRKTASESRLLSSPPAAPTMYFSPDGGHVVDESPLPVDGVGVAPQLDRPSDLPLHHHKSAPPKLGGDEDSQLQRPPPPLKFSLDHQRRQQPPQTNYFDLDPDAPLRAVREKSLSPGGEVVDSKGKGKELPAVGGEAEGSDAPPPDWGECFKVEWLERRKIPFHRTRHLRNPWNKGREIKISRDGTELEPTVGKRLLEEWGTLADPDNSVS